MADNLGTIRCPACGEEMRKVFIKTVGIYVDVCINSCGGIYFDNREFKNFDEQHEDAGAIFDLLDNKEFIQVDEKIKRTCPSCGARMVKNFSSIKREIQVDECYKCGGKFLDNGELEKIRAEYTTEEERTADFANKLYSVVGKEYEELIAKNNKWNSKRATNWKNLLINITKNWFKKKRRY